MPEMHNYGPQLVMTMAKREYAQVDIEWARLISDLIKMAYGVIEILMGNYTYHIWLRLSGSWFLTVLKAKSLKWIGHPEISLRR